MITIEVNNRKLEATEGESILDVLKRHGISVPTLCHMAELFPTGACRPPCHRLQDALRAFAAWNALAARFVIEELRDVLHQIHYALRLIRHYERARARRKLLECERLVQRFLADARA